MKLVNNHKPLSRLNHAFGVVKIMRRYTKILLILLYVSSITMGLTCFIYWVLNPEFSKMQVFLKFWYWFAINLALGIWFAKVDLK